MNQNIYYFRNKKIPSQYFHPALNNKGALSEQLIWALNNNNLAYIWRLRYTISKIIPYNCFFFFHVLFVCQQNLFT